MSMPTIRHEVAMMLSQVNTKIAEAESALAAGTLREKVNAAGDLDALRRQKQKIEARLVEVDARLETSETFLAWLKEQILNLDLQLDSLLAQRP